jgi:RHS repeat-associated protein
VAAPRTELKHLSLGIIPSGRIEYKTSGVGDSLRADFRLREKSLPAQNRHEDAAGKRVAKGTITTMSCDPTANGFQFTENYVLGPGGEELTQFSVSGGVSTWQRTNLYAGGKLLGTADELGLHFHLEDPLGTRRMQLSGNLANPGQPETDIQSLPYGDQLNPYPDQYAATSDDSTPFHFTGKERDTESGNDYFGARYYASSMVRFMSPDPGPFIWRDPQTLNRYPYTRDNPLKYVDPTGMYFVINPGDTNARKAISMMLRSKTGRALVESIAADPRPTYVKQGRLPFGNGSYIVGDHHVDAVNQGGHEKMTGTTVTVDWINAIFGAQMEGNKLAAEILKAYFHEFSHVADANGAQDYFSAVIAACMGDGNNCDFTKQGTTHGSAEAMALKILGELGDPDSYTPDADADAEADSIIQQGNDEENGDAPFGNSSGVDYLSNMRANDQQEDMQRQCAGNPAACN